MKKVFTIAYLLVASSFLSLAQNRYLDSLLTVLPTASNPIARFRILDDLTLESVNTIGSEVDSSYCFQLVQIAQDLHNDSLLAISYNWVGSFFYLNKGDHASALEFYFRGIPLAKAANDKRRISSLYIDIGLVYLDLQNNQEGLRSSRKAAENLPEVSSPMYDYMLVQYQNNMAQYFYNVNQPDSLFYYAQALANTNQRMKSVSVFKMPEFIFNGSAYAQIGDLKMADAYFDKADELNNSVEQSSAKYQFYNIHIPYLLANNRISLASKEARELLNLGINNNNNNLIKQAGARFLRQAFDAQHILDSAYYYSRMESELNDLIFSQSNKNKIQAIALNEQLRGIEDERKKTELQNQVKQYGLLSGFGVILIIAFILYRSNRQKQITNLVLEKTLNHLKSTQSQLIQSEKMASLGELTAGIAHEIQNPLNFVNNFSEINTELIDELKKELATGSKQLADEIADDIKSNSEKINHHGKRAGDIVKGMLQHSRSSGGVKEPTDINVLADEYLRLAYHGLRAKDKSFNATMKTDFDESIGSINVVPQDMGRVILNLITNAFYAVNERHKAESLKPEVGDLIYEPTVSISTKKKGDKVLISVKDNGNGIPQKVLDKIFQPFFTTKPTGQGTGLGLSMSYDIVKAHGGELTVETLSAEATAQAGKEGEGSEFIIKIPII